ncbi:restriction endonuclease [Lactobacillus delbrueckii subsp. bulgaricus]|nr:restriction endonuclease [Lactobacillus delbrueckii subsp. bulgaricus]MBT8833953.1 restriction endonuclease [Lactobacillus delbrueckii subsp. bulgaricus]MBT9036588.1 restriction endonuclease [Lactobacillus delbrueckii subsp. bulgaricus]MBT9055382.1 restriction endonuclease [Lactobacillus delbrueckii subsp. bulgaricus]
MKDEKKAPKLRFKGFTDDWVQRNLADLSDGFSYGLNAAAKEYDGVHGYLRITDIDEVSHSFLPEGLTSPDVPENQLTDYRMDEQSIVYARTGASTGKTYIYRDSDGELYYAGFLIRQKVNKETSAQFVYQNTLTKAWERYVQVMSQRSGQPGINAQEVGRFELAIPEKAEQDKIAHLFNSLDNLIAANQRKLAKLKELKQGYLQKMFPKNGAKVPELRFAGFADDWEERKLGDFLSIPKKIRADVTESRDLMTLKLNLGGIGIGANRETLELGSTIYYERKAGQFIYGKQNFFNGSMAIIPPEFDGKATSGDVPSLDISGINPNYLYTYVSRRDYWKRKEASASGTGSKRIHEATLFGFDISVPTLKEQQKIGSFFKQLDDTIDLHQRKLDLLKEQKKGFLQKMFV